MLANTTVDLPMFSADAISNAYYAAFGGDGIEDHWAEVPFSYTRIALTALQSTVNQIRTEIFCEMETDTAWPP
jgi:hypothetical protein